MAAKIMPDFKGTLLQVYSRLFSLGFKETAKGKFIHDKYWCNIQPSVTNGKYILSVGVNT